MRNEKPEPKNPERIDQSTLIPMPRLEQVLCRRIGQRLSVAEHKRCPYCFGHADDIANGQYERFCDYLPGRDPLLFGFPSGAARDLES